MNPFRSRKKSLTEALGMRRPSLEETIPPTPIAPPSSRGRTFRRKRSAPTPKPQFDLNAALPSSDAFRTSLLMPNLSARFSMLREQDDPTTKIGKANDDSVLFPKRASRLDLFGHGNLSDIAEVASLHASIRPPFAGRSNSLTSNDDTVGYGTDDESTTTSGIMNRSKPGHGNQLFGGRQKVYKIPMAGSIAPLPTDGDAPSPQENRAMGKAVYHDDVHTSAFQRDRALAKQQQQQQNSSYAYGPRRQSDDSEDHSLPDRDRLRSRTSAEERRRETSSSTASADGHPSTAATSVTSQNTSPLFPPASTASPTTASNVAASASPTAAAKSKATPSSAFASKLAGSSHVSSDRPAKARRLYGQGLDQQIQEQQVSALHRLNTLTRNPRSQDSVHQDRSAQPLATSGHQQSNNPLASSTSPNDSLQATPAATGLAAFDFGNLGGDSTAQSKSGDRGDESHDRGNLAASRPSAPKNLTISSRPLSPTLLDSSQPLSPTSLSSSRPLSPASLEPDAMLLASLEPNDVGKATASGAFNKPQQPYSEQQYTQRQLQLQEAREQDALRQLKLQKSPEALNEVPPAVDGAAGSLRSMTRQGMYGKDQFGRLRQGSLASQHPPPASSSLANGGQPAASPAKQSSRDQVAEGTYLAGLSESEPEDNVRSREASVSHSVPDRQLSVSHGLPKDLPASLDAMTRVNGSAKYAHDDQHPAFAGAGSDAEINVSDLPADTPSQAALSDMIRGHLRAHSNQSSIYPDSEPDVAGSGDRPQNPPLPSSLTSPSYSYAPGSPLLSPPPQPGLGSRPPAATTTADDGAAARGRGHMREVSSETQREREAFASTLADRRRQVADNLKSIVQEESRAASPSGMRGDALPNKAGIGMSLLKKGSRGSLNGSRGRDSPIPLVSQIPSIGSSGPTGSGSALHGAPYSTSAGPALKSQAASEIQRPRAATDDLARGASPWMREPSGRMSPVPRSGSAAENQPPSHHVRMPREDGALRGERSIGAERRERAARKAAAATQARRETAASSGPRAGAGPSSLASNGAHIRHGPGSPASGPSAANARRGAASPSRLMTQRPLGPSIDYSRPKAQSPVSAQQMAYHPAGRARKYSPPHPTLSPTSPTSPGPRSMSATGHRSEPMHASHHTSPALPSAGGLDHPSPSADSPRPSPMSPTFAMPPKPIADQQHSRAASPFAPAASGHVSPLSAPAGSPQLPSAPPTPGLYDSTQQGRLQTSTAYAGTNNKKPTRETYTDDGSGPRKRSVNKQEISEPTFVSGTSSVITVPLPPGASLSNGMDEVRAAASHVPPVPPVNPRRKGRMHLPNPPNVFTAFGSGNPGANGRSASAQGHHRSPNAAQVPPPPRDQRRHHRPQSPFVSSAGGQPVEQYAYGPGSGGQPAEESVYGPATIGPGVHSPEKSASGPTTSSEAGQPSVANGRAQSASQSQTHQQTSSSSSTDDRKPRARLRKTSSEGGILSKARAHARAKQTAATAAVPPPVTSAFDH